MRIKKTNKNHQDIIFLREKFPWMGGHSGYDLLYQYVSNIWQGNVNSVLVARNKTFLKRKTDFFLSGCSSRINNLPYYDSNSMLGEATVLLKLLLNPNQIMHTMYLEMDYGLFAHLKDRFSTKIVGTAHQSPGWWRMKHREPNRVSSLDALIVLSSAQEIYFKEYLPGRVHFIRHGIDTDFFKPVSLENEINYSNEPHCVFCGHWLRDIQKLAIVIDKVLEKNRRIFFDLILTKDKAVSPDFYRIARHDQVQWHSGISDTKLRDLYQQAILLFIPLIDCTANNALLESVACGLPVITTDVGGVRDYTDESFAEFFDLEDIDGMRDAILNLADDKSEQKRRKSAARDYAEENLGWRKIAHQTIELYKDTL